MKVLANTVVSDGTKPQYEAFEARLYYEGCDSAIALNENVVQLGHDTSVPFELKYTTSVNIWTGDRNTLVIDGQIGSIRSNFLNINQLVNYGGETSFAFPEASQSITDVEIKVYFVFVESTVTEMYLSIHGKQYGSRIHVGNLRMAPSEVVAAIPSIAVHVGTLKTPSYYATQLGFSGPGHGLRIPIIKTGPFMLYIQFGAGSVFQLKIGASLINADGQYFHTISADSGSEAVAGYIDTPLLATPSSGMLYAYYLDASKDTEFCPTRDYQYLASKYINNTTENVYITR